MQKIFCPMCGELHESIPYKCECGYEETKKDYNDINKKLFAIYKFSKKIFNKKIEWKQSNYDLINYSDNLIGIHEIFDDRSISYVDLQVEDKSVEATNGFLAFNLNVKSLIINVDYLDEEILDESIVKMLFIGDRVKKIPACINTNLKYIEVDKNNPNFSSLNNVLFNKNMSKLIFYCCLKPDEEYNIPKSVKVVDSGAFISCSRNNMLKIIHCSKDVIFEDSNCSSSPYKLIKIIRDL